MRSFQSKLQLFSFIALGLLGAGCDKKAAPPAMPPAPVAVVTVKPETVPMVQEYIGRGVSPYDVELRSLVTGILKERPMVDGAEVKAGDLLFVIDDVPFRAAVDNAKARVAQYEAALRNAERTLARLKAVSDPRAVSDKDLDDAVNGVASARALLSGAKADVVKAEWDLANTRITAPVSGRLGKANVVPGAPIAANGAPLVRLQQTDPIWVQFSIPESATLRFTKEVKSGRISNAKESDIIVNLKLGDGTLYPVAGRMNFADINLNTSVSAMESRAIFANPDKSLKPGQFFTVILSGPMKHNVFLVPQRAVQINPTNRYVYVVGREGKTEARDIVTAEWIGDRWVVESGLKDGDRVIVEGIQGVQMRGGLGVAVAPTEWKPAPDAK